ncbi:MAG TPA: hypothetical protein DCR43_00315 [Bacteroidales bacterium]|nr:MAG: hypothetical protein A2X11_07740 [Bacteroidetes bacterium GWE2_42_24]OFY26472.1 MAG: hypothetical protein A2X09_02215 [Bacteroidetes bacterium GWF2_43_11]HAQ64294.1 hypothetical protein [Bacteroidales bacterium]HBZ67719.1 hypothetical protein [Bacteroidales bacterium]
MFCQTIVNIFYLRPELNIDVMPPRKTRKKFKRRLKSKSITVKLTGQQMLSLNNYCKLHDTTPNKVIKARISPFTSVRFRQLSKDRFVLPNQLDLFG